MRGYDEFRRREAVSGYDREEERRAGLETSTEGDHSDRVGSDLLSSLSRFTLHCI